MGQAKLRGTKAERIAEALAREKPKREPEFIPPAGKKNLYFAAMTALAATAVTPRRKEEDR